MTVGSVEAIRTNSKRLDGSSGSERERKEETHKES